MEENKMEKMQVLIQSKTKPTTPRKSLKFLDKWHEVVGDAVQFFDKVNYKEVREIGLEAGKVVFIGGISGTQSQPITSKYANPEPKDIQERIMKTACFNMASRVVAQHQIAGENKEFLYAQCIRTYAEKIYKELQGFLKSETTEEGMEIPMKEPTA